MSEAIVGICMGAAGLLGIVGSFMYPSVRRWVGLPRTGMIALTLEWIFLSACVVSVWLPGSSFDLENPDKLEKLNCTNLTAIVPADNITTHQPFYTIPTEALGIFDCPDKEVSIISVSVLMGGIVASRVGMYSVQSSFPPTDKQTMFPRGSIRLLCLFKIKVSLSSVKNTNTRHTTSLTNTQ
uniref:Solute carrier family 40 member n=1 Tax=Biomphalaria glabrata TaxID=6526 RepID=A0A2C9M0F1_BIOGL